MKYAVSRDNWNQFRGDRGQKRDKADGEFEELYRFLEEKYGYSKGKAKEIDRRIRRDRPLGGSCSLHFLPGISFHLF
jgi:hypothetical protein